MIAPLAKTIMTDERDANVSGSTSTMSSVTEVVMLDFKPEADAPHILSYIDSIVSRQPGCQRARTFQRTRTSALKFTDWDGISSHAAFEASEDYAPFRKMIDPSFSSAPVIFHVPFVPFPPAVLDDIGKSSVIEVFHLWFPVEKGNDMIVQQEALTAVEQFIEQTKRLKLPGFSGETAYGWVMEDLPLNFETDGEQCRVLMAVLGWKSIEAHEAYQKMPEYSRLEKNEQGEGLKKGTITLIESLADSGLKDMGSYYVSCHTTDGGI